MGCGSCSTGACSTGGCGQKGGCKTGGCNKLNSYDWFDGMQQPTQSEFNNVYEVRFKSTRKEFFRNVNGLSLITGDFVAVESDRGFDVGQISLGGILAQLQMRKKKVRGGVEKMRKIYRRATKDDLEKLQLARSREQETLVRCREIVKMLKIDMKMSEVEYQGDNTKGIFYYIAEQRVDFRELIKLLANEFRIRIEMKQIGLRFESALVGGIGSCGRELCCSTWLSDFKTVSTAAARYQNLSLNPMKISGQCGRLKCCLNFELDSYFDALKDIPKVDRIETDLGMAYLQKTDIFKRTMWFSYAGDSSWIPMEADKVMEMSAMNKKGIKPASLHSLDKVVADEDKEADFVDVVGQAVFREDPKRKKKKKNKQSGDRSGSKPNHAMERAGEGADGAPKNPEGKEQRDKRPQSERRDRHARPRPQNREGSPKPQGQEKRGPGSESQNPRDPKQQKQGGSKLQNQQKQGGPRYQGQDQRPPSPPRNENQSGPDPKSRLEGGGGQVLNNSGRDFRNISKKPPVKRNRSGEGGSQSSGNPPSAS
jgi:cell fate regulator YaaT (PSP1 superfamily)